MGWINLAQDQYQQPTVVNRAVNDGCYKLRGISGLAEELQISQRALWSIELDICYGLFVCWIVTEWYSLGNTVCKSTRPEVSRAT